METQKIANLLGDAHNESSELATRNGMLSTMRITQIMVKEIKIVQPLNSKSKSLSQIFVLIQTHIFLEQGI